MFIEYIIIVGLILFQFYIAWDLWGKIILYKSIFEHSPDVVQILVPLEVYNDGNVKLILSNKISPEESKIVELTILKNNSANKVFSTILYQINSYLIKNKGATIDFHLIKDTVDRNVEIIEEDINNRIPAPLYIGLAATMLGIIFGLFLVHFDSVDNALNAIQPLIDGVKIAMSASVLGLIITTVFSVKIFKDANYKVEEEKNTFLSQIQSELLPRMNRSNLPEVETLSNKLDLFARNTIGSISLLDNIVKTSSATVQREHELINDIRKLDVAKITSANVEVFSQLDGMMDSFKNFANYYNKLNSSITGTTELVNNLQRFIASTDNINVVLEGIKEIIEQGNEATSFFNNHIKSFSNYGDAVNEAVINADSKMSKAIAELGRLTEAQFNAFNESVANFDSKLSTAFNHSIEKFTLAMNEQVIRTEEAFEKGRPKFEKLEQLDKLDQLDSINQRLLHLEENLSIIFTKNSKDIISAIRKTKDSNTEVPDENEIIPNPKDPELSMFEIMSLFLKTGAYAVVVIYGVHALLHYFKLI